jgi:hypothetical protein
LAGVGWGESVAVAQSDLRRVRRARERLGVAERDLVLAIVAAHESGETFHDIGLEAGLSRQRAHEIFKAELRRRDEESE